MNPIKKNLYYFFLFTLSPLRGLGLRRYPLVRYLLAMFKPDRVVMNGFTLYLDRTDESTSRQMFSGSYEELETKAVIDLVRPGMTVVDIGANIGYFAVLLAHLVGEHGFVYAFEPAPVARALLLKNIHSNGMRDRVIVYDYGISDHAGDAKLYINEYNKGNNRLYKSGDMRSIPIMLRRLDEVLPPDKHVDLIKMDIEGAEALALRGMQDTIAKYHPIILMEFAPCRYKKLDSSAEEILNTLTLAGYRFEDIDEASGKVHPVNVEELLARYPINKDIWTNVLCRI